MRKLQFLDYLGREIKTHLWQYLLLLTVSVFFILLFSILKGNRLGQFLITTLFVVFYLVWGIIHHFLEKTLNLKVVVEYILIGAIALFFLKNLIIP